MRVRKNLPTALAVFGFAVLLSACSSSSTSPTSTTPTGPTGVTPFSAETYLAQFASRTDLLEFSDLNPAPSNALQTVTCVGGTTEMISSLGGPAKPFMVKWDYATKGAPPHDLDITGCLIGVYVGPSDINPAGVPGVATINDTHIKGDSGVGTGIWVNSSSTVSSQASIDDVQIQGVTLHSSVKCTKSTCVVSNLHVQNGDGHSAAQGVSGVGLRAEGGSNMFASQVHVDGYNDRGFLCVASQCGISDSHMGGPNVTNPIATILPVGYEFVFAVNRSTITDIQKDQSDGDGSAKKGLAFLSICSIDSGGHPITSDTFFEADVHHDPNHPDPVFVYYSAATAHDPTATAEGTFEDECQDQSDIHTF